MVFYMPETFPPSSPPETVRRPQPATIMWKEEAERIRDLAPDWVECRYQWVTTHMVKRGVLLAFQPAGDFDAIKRNNTIYVRYVGSPSDESTVSA